MHLIINTDGASRGNPGPAAIGATLKDGHGHLVARISRAIGRTTNNQAEYRALIAALEEALRLGATEVDINLDSELLARQVTGVYRVRNEALKPLHLRIRKLLAGFRRFDIHTIPREQNTEADRLANMAFGDPGY